MPASPKSFEQKMERMLSAWKTLAPDKKFAGMTFADFEARCAPSRNARKRLAELEDERTQKLADRDVADKDADVRMKQVVAGVLADPDYGPDSALYEAFGYIPDHDRKSGLHRGKQKEQDGK